MLGKLLSGRYLLTVASAVAFLYLVFTKIIDAKDAMMIITMVFSLYFARNDRTQNKVDALK